MAFLPDRREVEKVLKKHGFYSVRFNGRHELFKNDDGVTFPLAKQKTVPKGTLKNVSRATGIDMFRELEKQKKKNN